MIWKQCTTPFSRVEPVRSKTIHPEVLRRIWRNIKLLQVANALRCPATKFITHTLSHICFLILLAAATFRLDGRSHVITSTPTVFQGTYGEDDFDRLREDVEYSLKDVFRPANTLLTHVQICLMFWIFGNRILSTWVLYFRGYPACIAGRV